MPDKAPPPKPLRDPPLHDTPWQLPAAPKLAAPKPTAPPLITPPGSPRAPPAAGNGPGPAVKNDRVAPVCKQGMWYHFDPNSESWHPAKAPPILPPPPRQRNIRDVDPRLIPPPKAAAKPPSHHRRSSHPLQMHHLHASHPSHGGSHHRTSWLHNRTVLPRFPSTST